MYHFRILSIGKTKEEWLESAIAEYLKRLQATATLTFVWAKNDGQLLALIEKEKSIICLDAEGQGMNSQLFSSFLIKQLETHGASLTFVIGGPEGLPATLKKGYPLISLSPMTFTHQMVRLILVEQIYRAIEIDKGSHYHK